MANVSILPGGSIPGTDPDPEWTLGDRLRKARTRAGIDRADVAAEAGCTDATISNYELDRTRVPKLVVELYARMTRVRYEWLANDLRPPGTTVPITECYSVSQMLEEAA